MTGYCLGHRHGGSRFCFWLLAFTGLARERASKLTSFLAYTLLRSRASNRMKLMRMRHKLCTTARAVYIISALYSFLWALHVCKVCPFTALFTMPYCMRVCRYVVSYIVCDGRYLNRVQQGASEASPLLVMYSMINLCVWHSTCINKTRTEKCRFMLHTHRHTYAVFHLEGGTLGSPPPKILETNYIMLDHKLQSFFIMLI